jgi:hypothetical protein
MPPQTSLLVQALFFSLLTASSFVAGCGGGGNDDPSGNGGQPGAAGSSGTAGRAGSGGPAGAGGMAPLVPGCTPMPFTSSGTLTGRYGKTHLTSNGRDYFLQVNQWNTAAAGNQTVAYGGSTVFKMTDQTANAATNGAPTGYPSIFIGANNNNSTTGSNLPKAVSSLSSVLTTWNWTDAGTIADYTNNSFNAAYDVWFSTSASGEPSASGPSGGFLMVWLHDPRDAQPIGSVTTANVTIPGVPGAWDVWVGKNGNKPCISYVPRTPIMSLSFDLNLFIKDAVANRTGTIQSNWYLTNVFAGFEIWRGGVNIETTGFCAVVQ